MRASFVLALAMTLVGGVARGDEPSPPALAASLQKFDEGRVAFEAKHYDEARAAFEASHKLQASPNSLLYIARCFREVGRVASAYVTFKRSEREAQDRLTATLEKRYAATRDAAASEAADLAPRIPRLTVNVPPALPSDFAVTLNGREVFRESWGLALETDPGAVHVEAHGHRMKSFNVTVRLSEGEHRVLEVGVERLPTATVSATFSSKPQGLSVELDGVPVSPGEMEASLETDPGSHRLVVTAPAHVPFRWEGVLVDAHEERVVVRLTPQTNAARGTPPWLFFAAGGAAVVTAVVGSGLAFDARSRDREETAKNPLLRDPSTRSAIQSEAIVANALFISSAVLAVGTTILGFTTAWRSPKAQVGSTRIYPWVAASTGGFGFEGAL